MRDLVLRAQGGDGGALSCLVEQYQAALRRFCRRLLHNPASAQDLAQETLMRALQALPLLEDPNRFSGWLHGIALNLARIWWRRQSREPLSLDLLSQNGDNALGHGDRAGEGRGTRISHLVVLGPEEAVMEAERTEQVRRAVASLPPVLGRTVALHYLDGYSCAEIAGALRVPVSTVKTRLFKSRGRLRLVLAPQEEADVAQLLGSIRGQAAKPMAPSAPRSRPSHDAPTAAQTKAQKGTTPMVTTHEPAEGKSQDAGTAQSQSATRLPQNVLHCSFCLSPHDQVERLIAGPGQVYICNRCVAKCNDILRREGVPL